MDIEEQQKATQAKPVIEKLKKSHQYESIQEILKRDLEISCAPDDSPSGPPHPAESDFQVYIPSLPDKSDAVNQHFIACPLTNGDFFATWTMAALEGSKDQHLVISRSSDCGRTWSKPEYFDGPENDGFIASWGFPFIVPHTGRIYIFYNKNMGLVDNHVTDTGKIAFRFSDDNGYSWSRRYVHLKLESNSFSHPNPETDANWITYQAPIITISGNVLVGVSHFASRARLPKSSALNPNFGSAETRFIRFDNVLTEENPEKLFITTLPVNGADGIRMADPRRPGMYSSYEPSVQCLSDGRLFCVMRTATGYAAYAISSDEGLTWSEPEVLRYHTGGAGIRQPVAPCPLYKLRDGRFLFIFHNNKGYANSGRAVNDWCRNRRPVYLSVGKEISHATKQPIMFKKPVLLADNDRVPISAKQLTEIGTYGSLFEYGGKVYFFFPDRKHYLLGKMLSEDLLSDTGLP